MTEDNEDYDQLSGLIGEISSAVESNGEGGSGTSSESQEQQPSDADTSVSESTNSWQSDAIAPPAAASSEKQPDNTANRAPSNLSEDEVRQTQTIVRVLDEYRSLGDREKQVSLQFIAEGRDVPNEESAIVAVLHAGEMLKKTIRSLLEARDKDSVERSFYLMREDKHVVRNMFSLVQVFVTAENSQDTRNMDNIELTRSLVYYTDDLGADDMNYIEATNRLLLASEENRNR